MTIIEFKWDGVTPEQYEAAKRRVDWESNPDPNGVVHMAWFDNGALRCNDVWTSEETFLNFVQTRLMPGIEGLGIEAQPEIRFHKAHDTFILPDALVASR